MISGKDALLALANGEEVEFQRENSGNWKNAMTLNLFSFNSSLFKFRLKPRTVNLNGVEVGQLWFSQWDKQNPKEVIIEFKTEEDARHFNKNALNIFNGV